MLPMRGLCAECEKTVEGMIVPTEVDVCTFCQNSFHIACRRFQATTKRCEECVKQLVKRQIRLFKYKGLLNLSFVISSHILH
jgi:hypothetical protein